MKLLQNPRPMCFLVWLIMVEHLEPNSEADKSRGGSMDSCLNPGEVLLQEVVAESGWEKASRPTCQHFSSVSGSCTGDESLPIGVWPWGGRPVQSGCGQCGIINSGSAMTHLWDFPNPNMNFLGCWTRESPRPFPSLKCDSLTKCSFVKAWTVFQFHYRVPLG